MRIVAVVLNWRRPTETIACVRSIHETAPDVDVIVVDNASDDGSAEAIRGALPDVTLIENAYNLGYAGGNNVGIKAALERNAGAVLILNNDVVIQPGCVARLSAELEDDDGVAAVAPVSLRADDPNIVDFFVAEFDRRAMALRAYGRAEPWLPPPRPEPSDYLTGSALLVHTDAFALEGHCSDGFDESFFLVWEDVDLCLRLKRGNPSGRDALLAIPDARVLHAGSVSFGSDPGASPLYQYFFVRNSFLIARKHLRWPWRARTRRLIERRYRGWAEQSDEPVKRAMLLGLEHGLAGRFGPPPPELMPPGSRLPPW